MANIIISDLEWSMLAGEPSDYFKLYAAVKRRMDFVTGIAGVKTLINETVLRDAYVVDPVQGRAKPKPITRQRYRSGIARLEKLGLLERIGKLVFSFPKAPLDRFAQNNNNQKTTGQRPKSSLPLQAVNASTGKPCGDSNQRENTVPQPKSSDDNNLLPAFRASYLLTSSSPAAQSEGEAEVSTAKAGMDAAPLPSAAPAQFPMSLDWQPNHSSLETLASHLGVSLDGFTDEVLARFTAYWTFDEPECQKTQKQWERQLVCHLEHKRQYAEKQEQQAQAKAAKAAELSSSGVKPEKTRKSASGKVIPLRTVPPAPVNEPANAQETAMNPVFSHEMVNVVFQKIHGLYAQRFERQFHSEPCRAAWAEVLDGLSSTQIAAGFRNLIDRSESEEGKWPPSALEFRHLCLQIPGLPTMDRAWFEAVHAQYSHKAVAHAAKLTGLGALKNVKSGTLDHHQIRTLKGSFELNYQLIKDRLQKGEPLQGQQAAEREQEKQRQEAYPEYERLKRLIECGERPTADNALRQQAAQARREAQALREQFNFEPLPAAPVIAASSANVQSIRQGYRA